MKSDRVIRLVGMFSLLVLVPACNYVQQKEMKDERKDHHYQEAMADFQAGRLDAAASGFEKAIKADPSNASARFQLACLQQDNRHEYLAALCNYREYLRFEPSSDKARMAKDRYALCEIEVAKELARKMNLTDNAALAAEGEKVRAALAAAEKQIARLNQDCGELKERVSTLQQENVRLRRMVSTIGDTDGEKKLNVSEAKALLADEDEDRLKLSPDAKAIFDEEEAEEKMKIPSFVLDEDGLDPLLGGSKHIGEAAPEGKKLTDFTKPETKAVDPSEPPHEARPEYYEVEEGDTLFKIAMRFYGRKSAWAKIREANKATISSDGRIKIGQKLRLP